MTPHTAGWIPPPRSPSYSPVVVAVVNNGRVAEGTPPPLLLLEEFGGASGPIPVVRVVNAPSCWSTTRGMQSAIMQGRHSVDTPNRADEAFHDLTAFQRDTLVAIAGLDSPAGVQVRDELNAYYAAAVEHSRLYQALNKLADKGIIEVSAKDARTNAYELTPHGERVMLAGQRFRNQMTGGGVDAGR